MLTLKRSLQREMKTTKYRLRDLVIIRNGKDHSSLNNGAYPVLGSGGVMRYADKFLYSGESVLLPRKGTLSNIQYINGAFWTVDTCYYTEVNEEIILPYYLYITLKNIDLSGLDSGASIPSMTSKTYYGIKIDVPTLSHQHKILGFIRIYDDLIENNNRRIRLLEQMAENLYKEWFVRFRFPGHEQAEFENGIPKGWEMKHLGEELVVKRGGSPRPIHEYISDTGLKWLKISDATQSDNPYIVNIEESIIEEGLKKTVYLKAGSLVLSNSATPGLPRILTIDSCIHDGWLYFPKKKLSNEYLYLLFNHIRPYLLSKGNGAIFTNLKTDILKRYLFIKPTDIILSLFNDLVKPIFSQIYSLTMKNQNLTKQRDMLLPRLMSGKLEV